MNIVKKIRDKIELKLKKINIEANVNSFIQTLKN